jgi:hypothetical protein
MVYYFDIVLNTEIITQCNMKILVKNIKGKFSMERYSTKEFFHETLFNLGHMHTYNIKGETNKS